MSGAGEASRRPADDPRPGARRLYRRRLHFGPVLGTMSAGLSPKTVANTLKVLHGVFEHAIDPE